jgi:hypothetical protein
MVQLKNGKELKIKRENIELADGSIKGGFLSQVLRPDARFACRKRGGEKGAGVVGRDLYPCYHIELTNELLIFTNN